MKPVPAVYRIKKHIGGQCYVGATTNLRQRIFLHKSDLRHNRHHSKSLQADWNEFGEDAFGVEVLEYVEDDENVQANLEAREQYWMDWFDSHSRGYNEARKAGRSTEQLHTPESIARRTAARRRNGTVHGQKLTWEQVKAIRKEYGPPRGFGNAGSPTLRELADKYGVDESNIGLIVRRRIWKTNPLKE